jgi:hypothetical protein
MIKYDVIVIGGGFFGCMIASRYEGNVLILEESEDILQFASVNNQARVHNGYHYPRSEKTAFSSHKNYEKFSKDFSTAVLSYGEMLYPIAKESLVSPDTFFKKYKEIGCPIELKKDWKTIFNPHLIEEVFSVEEKVFDGNILRETVRKKIKNKNLKTNSRVSSVRKNDNSLTVTLENGEFFSAERVMLCVYEETNQILRNSSLPEIDLIVKHSMMPLIRVPEEFQKLSMTIMDGPFFSIMPFPMQKCHSIHHVKLTPNPESKFENFYEDVVRFVPGLSKMKQIGSIVQKKTVFPQNSEDDGRPIMYKKDYGFENFDVIVGGKIDNIYDIFDIIDGKVNNELNII